MKVPPYGERYIPVPFSMGMDKIYNNVENRNVINVTTGELR
jgi:hypothetical protein